MVPIEYVGVVVAGEVRSATLTEPNGATIEVDVVDAEGVARPFATAKVVQPTRLPWVDLEGGVQRLDRYVDELGRRTFRHVEPGRVRLEASWARRKVETTVDVRDGETRRVRIVVPAAGT
jgi:hypothetical protein